MVQMLDILWIFFATDDGDEGKFAYLNPAFVNSEVDVTDEEIHEIRRVSRVPFDPSSSTYLNKVILISWRLTKSRQY